MNEDKNLYHKALLILKDVPGKVVITSIAPPEGTFLRQLWDIPLVDTNRLSKPLTNAQMRDWSMIRQFIESGGWWTSIKLAKAMYSDGNFTNREIKKVSSILSKLFHDTSLLERQEKRRIFFNNIHKRHLSTWAYRLNINLINEYESINQSIWPPSCSRDDGNDIDQE